MFPESAGDTATDCGGLGSRLALGLDESGGTLAFLLLAARNLLDIYGETVSRFSLQKARKPA